MSASVEKNCIYCVHSNGEFENCHCLHKGAVSPNGKCRKYKLDLLKIKPRPPLNLNMEDIVIEKI